MLHHPINLVPRLSVLDQGRQGCRLQGSSGGCHSGNDKWARPGQLEVVVPRDRTFIGSASKARRRRKRRWLRAKIGGEADAGSEAGVVGAEAGVEAGSCCSEAGLELKRMLVLMQLLVGGQGTSQKSDDACP